MAAFQESYGEHPDDFPHVLELSIALLEGAKETFHRFLSDLRDAALQDAVSFEVFTPATNDVNEGSLGALRNFRLSFPTASLSLHNAKAMYMQNETAGFVTAMLQDEESQQYLRQGGRKLGEKTERSFRAEISAVQDEQAKDKKKKVDKVQEKKAKRRGLKLMLTDEEVAGLSNAGAGDLLDAWRERELPEKMVVPYKSKLNWLEWHAALKQLAHEYRTQMTDTEPRALSD